MLLCPCCLFVVLRLMFAVLLFVVRSFVVGCCGSLRFVVVWCVLFAVDRFRLLFVDCCLLCVACNPLRAVCCSLFVVCCYMSYGGWWLFVAWRSSFDSLMFDV